MKVLILGGGGREHAIAWKLAADDPTVELVAAPGNPGIASLGRCVQVQPTDASAVVALGLAERAELVVIGPEAPLAAGVADACRAAGLRVFGPSRAAARLESSKRFAKELMLQVGIPTAAATWHTTPVSARAALREHGFPVVIKASGLAAGKGVIVAETMGEAEHAVDAIMVEGAFGAAGSEVLVEDFMRGEELSVFAVSDGANFVVLPTAQDHKRLLDGDRGPNTGGMGAYAPASLGSPSVLRTVSIEIIAPVLAAMRDIGSPFVGLLYVGIMLTEHGPKVVEFNCRFGDPESQAVLTSMRAPLLPLLLGGSEAGGLRSQGWATAYDHYAVTTVVAVAGYPEKPIIGAEVVIPTMGEGQLCFHAGTAVSPSGQLVATGGRVLSVTGVGRTVAEAKARSLAGAERVQVEGGQFRRDIAWRELKRSAGAS